MIVDKTKSYITNSSFLSDDGLERKDVYIVDETTEEGLALAKKIQENSPHFDFVIDEEGNLVDIIPLPRPEPEPIEPEPTTEEILLLALMEIQGLKQKVAELEGGK